MIEYKSITLDDKQWIDPLLKENNRRGCEYSFATKYIWSKAYNVQVAKVNGCFVSKNKVGSCVIINYPAGLPENRKLAVKSILNHQKSISERFYFHGLEKEQIEELEEVLPNQFEYKLSRDDCDYVYLTEKLITLSGKKLQSKRNHIRRFEDEPDWQFEEITANNISHCIKMSEEWYSNKLNANSIEFEKEALSIAFEKYFELKLSGGLIRRKGEVIAFALGEALNEDTFVTHFEKAYGEIQGAYAIINREFTKHFAKDFLYINREEDIGLENLRKAKISYYPEFLVEKYKAIPNTLGCNKKSVLI